MATIWRGSTLDGLLFGRRIAATLLAEEWMPRVIGGSLILAGAARP
jgi:hypothetical protein